MERKKVAFRVWLGLFILFMFYSFSSGAFMDLEFPISTAVNLQWYPFVAFDSVNQRYLVVWSDERNGPGNFDIYGQLANSNGALVGGAFAISIAANKQWLPTIAYDPVNQRYLVAWEDERSGGPAAPDIYGQLVDTNGGLIGGNFTISTAANGQYSPSVAYDAVNQRYLVTWGDQRSGANSDIYGRLINANGGLVGDEFAISTAVNSQVFPSIAYDSANLRFFVVWSDSRSGLADIYGQIVGTGGTLIGGNFTVSIAPDNQQWPSVAFDSVNQRFLVVWNDQRYGSNGCAFGQILNASGTLIGTDFSLSSSILSGVATGRLAVSFDPAIQRHLVVYSGSTLLSNNDIYGQSVNANGGLVGKVIPISITLNYQGWPSVAYDYVNQRYLVTWYDTKSGGADIYGRIVLGGNTTLSLPSGIQGVPYSTGLQITDGSSPYSWSIDSGSFPPGLSLNFSTGAISGVPTGAGVYPQTILATAANGFTCFSDLGITISPNVLPTVSLFASPNSGPAPLSVTFTATASDSDGTIAEYRWDFNGDGAVDLFTATSTAVYTFTVPGIYLVEVTVVDNVGASASDQAVVNATSPPPSENQPPVVSLVAFPSNGVVPLMVSFTATASDPDGIISEYRWDFTSNGIVDLTTPIGTTTFTYTTPGAYLAQVTAVDNLGAQTTAYAVISATSPPTPENQSPVVRLFASPITGPPPLAVTFTASASDPDGTIAEYRWDFNGDGMADLITTSSTVSNTYTSSGVYLAEVTVTDNVGATSSDALIINVVEKPQVTEKIIEKSGCGCNSYHDTEGQRNEAGNFLLMLLPFLFCIIKGRKQQKRKVITFL